MAGGVTVEVPTIKQLTKLLVINFLINLYALRNIFDYFNTVTGESAWELESADWRTVVMLGEGGGSGNEVGDDVAAGEEVVVTSGSLF